MLLARPSAPSAGRPYRSVSAPLVDRRPLEDVGHVALDVVELVLVEHALEDVEAVCARRRRGWPGRPRRAVEADRPRLPSARARRLALLAVADHVRLVLAVVDDRDLEQWQLPHGPNVRPPPRRRPAYRGRARLAATPSRRSAGRPACDAGFGRDSLGQGGVTGRPPGPSRQEEPWDVISVCSSPTAARSPSASPRRRTRSGMESVAVYPAVDERSLHTRLATEARPIGGPGEPVAAYLDAEAIVGAAIASGCDCVHPGYGFLAENAAFAERCAAAGLTFVGPSPAALALFGDKVRARALARSLGIPVVEGSPDTVATAEDAARIAAGDRLPGDAQGVGRRRRSGHARRRRCPTSSPRPSSAAAARPRRRSATARCSSSGSSPGPATSRSRSSPTPHGNVVHLYDRDCSVQLRNQKLIEVAPAAGLEPGLRDQLFAGADRARRRLRLRQRRHGRVPRRPRDRRALLHRVQPAHPGRAHGHRAGHGHRPRRGPVPHRRRRVAGRHRHRRPGGRRDPAATPCRPASWPTGVGRARRRTRSRPGPGVRVDGAGYVGYAPPPQFDPLLAKVIGAANSSSVADAVDRTRRAVDELHIAGLPTNRSQLLGHPRPARGPRRRRPHDAARRGARAGHGRHDGRCRPGPARLAGAARGDGRRRRLRRTVVGDQRRVDARGR